MKFWPFSSKKDISYPPNMAEQVGNDYFYFTGSLLGYSGFSRTRQLVETDTPIGQMLAYKFCSPLSTVISKICTAENNGVITITDQKGKEATGAKIDRAIALLERPNVLQTWNQFQEQCRTYLRIFGRCYIYPLRAFPSSQPSALYVLPNTNINIVKTGKYYNQTNISEIVKEYQLTDGGAVVATFLPSELIVVNDTILHPEDVTAAYSRLVSLLDPVCNIVAAYEARNVLATNTGPRGALSPEAAKDSVASLPLLPKDKDDLQKDFARYGLRKDQKQVIIAMKALKWVAMGFPTKDLMLFEEIEDDVREICNTYGYPFGLMNFKDNNAFASGEQLTAAQKSLYQDTVIPSMNTWAKVLKLMLGLESTNYLVNISYSHLPVFQIDEKAKNEALKLLNEACKIAFDAQLITADEWRQMAYPELNTLQR